MENRPQLRNRQCRSPDPSSYKKLSQKQQLCSPKFTRKRNDILNILSRRSQKIIQPTQNITYISPKKYLQQQSTCTQSIRSITSFTSFTRNDRTHRLKQIYINNQPQRQCISMHNIPQPLLPTNKSNIQPQNCQLNKKNTQLTKQLQSLKQNNQNLHKKIAQYSDKIKQLKKQNIELYKKIQSFNQIIGQKNQIINKFSYMLKQKQQIITLQHTQIQKLNKKIQQYQHTISILHKNIQQNQYNLTACVCNEQEIGTNDSDKQPLLQQIQKYKLQIDQLVDKIKYTSIQQNMNKKLRYDLKIQIQKNQAIKLHNRKLITRIQQLVNANNNGGRQGHVNCNRNRKQNQFIFQLSPEK